MQIKVYHEFFAFYNYIIYTFIIYINNSDKSFLLFTIIFLTLDNVNCDAAIYFNNNLTIK